MYLDTLLQELAQKTGLGELKLSPEGVVSFRFNDAYTCSIEQLPDGEHIVLYGVIGELPKSDREKVLISLLSANLFCSQTKGASFGLDTETQEIILSKQFALQGLLLNVLYEELQTFMQLQQEWTERIKT